MHITSLNHLFPPNKGELLSNTVGFIMSCPDAQEETEMVPEQEIEDLDLSKRIYPSENEDDNGRSPFAIGDTLKLLPHPVAVARITLYRRESL